MSKSLVLLKRVFEAFQKLVFSLVAGGPSTNHSAGVGADHPLRSHLPCFWRLPKKRLVSRPAPTAVVRGLFDGRNQISLESSKPEMLGLCVIRVFTISAAKYKHRVPRKCCLDGARHNVHETCAQRVARVTIGPNCVRAFNECCIIATKIRHEGSLKPMQLGRMRKYWFFCQNPI